MRFGTWNERSLYRSGSLITVARVLARYKLDLVGVWVVRWNKGGTVRAGDYFFFNCWKRNEYHRLGRGFFVHNTIISAVKSVDFLVIRYHM